MSADPGDKRGKKKVEKMAKIATIEFDDDGRAVVTHSDLPPHPPESSMSTSSTTVPPPLPKTRVPSSPHKPYTSTNFYDLTKSSPDISPLTSPMANQGESDSSSGIRVLKEHDTENIIPGPFAKSVDPPKDSRNAISRALSKNPHFIDPAALLPPNSSLWKSSKVDVRKPSYNLDSAHGDRKPSSHMIYKPPPPPPASNTSDVPRSTSSSNGVLLASMSRANSTAFDMPSNRPRPPPYIPSSSFVHPDTLLASTYQHSLAMIADKEQEALKNFFEAALEPEKDEDSTKETEDDDNAGKVDGLYVTLMKHQISGLEFLCAHETTLDKKGHGKYGGILADDMGLGKTIQTLALILTRPRPFEEGEKTSTKRCKGTLLVVPLALVDQWRREIVEKTNLTVYVHHGPKREKDPKRLVKWDVVITTYDTVRSEGFSNEKTPEDTFQGTGVFLVHWWRVVLDEAHTIKNPRAKMSQVCCGLTAEFRWCLTGTPYQNTVDDVYSLVKFLRIPPFSEWNYWKERITKPAKNGQTSLALTRLRTLLRAIMLRRTKDILKENGVFIPAKEVICEELEFDSHERKFYDDLLLRGQQVVEELKASRGGLSNNYMCLLTMLLRLRQATDHVDLLKGKLDDDKDAVMNQEPVPPTKVDDDDLVDMMSGLGIEAKCTICFTIITNGRGRCTDCEANLQKFQLEKKSVGRQSSSKIRRMLEILQTQVDDKPVKTIIFSQFTSMLDLIEPFLRDHNLPYGRYDGKMKKDARDAMLTAFRTTLMPVLLVSLKSGSVGLNLTSASRVIMVDMWWNPAIEEQAIDRVHRIGQTNRVVVHKLAIRGSVDEKIGELQAKKREAASGALGDGVIRRKGQGAQKLSLEDVLYLFSMPG